jgi:hypothetical protein
MICRVPAHKVNAKSNIRFRCENGVSKKKTRKHSFGNELAKQTSQQLFRSAGAVILPGCFSQINGDNVDAGSDVISFITRSPMRVSTFKNDCELTRSPMFQLPHKLSKTRCQGSVFDLGVVLTTARNTNLKDTKYAQISP